MGKIKLFHPRYDSLSFGQNNEIQFGLKGGFEPGHVIVDEDDPLVTLLLQLEPDVVVVQPEGPTQVFLCPLPAHADKEFKTRHALLAHLRGKNHEPLIEPEPLEA